MSEPETTRHPYITAPKDGRLIGLWAEDVGGPFPMRWEPDTINPLVGPHRGIWVMSDGSMTWSDHDPAGAPTHWQEIHDSINEKKTTEMDAATDVLEADIDKWVARERADSGLVPDFWDEQDASGRIAEYLVNAGYRRG